MHRLVPTLVGEMGVAYPELPRAQALIEEVLEREETRFRQTLANGLRLLDEATGGMREGGELPGETAFKLYDTFGFPYDLTEDALRVRGIGVDRAGFDAAMARQKAAARAAWKGSGAAADGEVWFDIAEREGATEFTGYASTAGEGQVVALVVDGKEVPRAEAGAEVTVLTNQTPFYGESGGQMGDSGAITSDNGMRIAVRDTSKPLGRLHAHHGRSKAAASPSATPSTSRSTPHGATAFARTTRPPTCSRGAAQPAGEHVTQKGSLVAEDRFRSTSRTPSRSAPRRSAASRPT
jgi:alanyl-tRNA synthetase